MASNENVPIGVISIDSDSSSTLTSDEIETLPDEIEVVKYIFKADKVEHSCDLCSKGTFLVNKLLRFGGVLNHKLNHACDVCDKGFKTLSELERHSKKHVKGGRDKGKTSNKGQSVSSPASKECKICERAFNTKTALNVHQTKVHNKVTHICELCGLVFKNFRVFNQHCLSHTSSTKKRFSCAVCKQGFVWRKTLKDHICQVTI